MPQIWAHCKDVPDEMNNTAQTSMLDWGLGLLNDDRDDF